MRPNARRCTRAQEMSVKVDSLMPSFERNMGHRSDGVWPLEMPAKEGRRIRDTDPADPALGAFMRV